MSPDSSGALSYIGEKGAITFNSFMFNGGMWAGKVTISFDYN